MTKNKVNYKNIVELNLITDSYDINEKVSTLYIYKKKLIEALDLSIP